MAANTGSGPGLKLLALAACALACLAGHWLGAEEAPPPAETPCEVIVSGRTSTLKSIVVRKAGQNVPRIYHGEYTCQNTPGFDWYVSQHYALKANVGDELAEHFLTLAELAYPHCVEIIGREPYGIETTRMAFVHATNLDLLQKAVISDIGDRWAQGGGGVTLPHSCAAYNFPSGGLQYHRNDLSLHEGLHLLQMAVTGGTNTPTRFTEGIAHLFANHVYDPKQRQLTVAVFDKAPVNNPLDAGLRRMREKGIPEIEDVIAEKTGGDWYPAVPALYTAFFWSSPERLMKWRIWRDELFAAGATGKTRNKADVETLRQLHGGSFGKLNEEWRAWLEERRTTFTHVDWGWEQWGETLQTYGWPWDSKYFSQMNLNYAPGKKLPPEPWRMDYPRTPKPPLVGPVQLGGEEPSAGCVVDFVRTKNEGWAGLGLGVDGRRLLRIVVDRNKALVLDGTLLKMKAGKRESAFPAVCLEAARKTKRVGLTVRIAKEAVEVTVKAGEGDAMKELTASYPITTEERLDLLSRPMALLSRDARHEITPYLEDPPPAQPDLSKPAPANCWRFAGDKETYRLYRAAWRMGDKAPASLTNLKAKMVSAMDKEADVQQKALAAYQAEFPKLVENLRKAGSAEAKQALVELSGMALALRSEPDAATGQTCFTAVVTGAQDSRVAGTVTFTASPESAVQAMKAPEAIEIQTGKQAAVAWTPKPAAGYSGTFGITARAEVRWQGVPLTLDRACVARPSIPCYWVIGPFDNKGEGTVDTAQTVEAETFDANKTYAGKDGKKIHWAKAERAATLGLEREYAVDLVKLYGGQNVSAYALVWVIAPRETEAELALGSDDGVVAWLNGKRVHAALENRGYQSRGDRAAVTLKAGANKLLLRITQTWGGWKFGAHIEGKDGGPLPELRYSLEPAQ